MILSKKPLAKILSGNAFAQIFVIFTLPFLTRIYSVDDFGKLGLINGVLLIVGVVSCLRYDQIIFNFNDKEKWSECFVLGLSCSIIFFILSSIIIHISVKYFGVYSGFYIFPFALLFFSITQMYSALLSVNKQYVNITKSVIIKVIFTFVSQYVLGLLQVKFALIYGLLLGLVFQSIYMIKVNSLSLKISRNPIKIKDALLSTTQSLFNSISSQIPTIFIPVKYGFEVMGYYSMALRLTYLPITFISNAIRPFILGELNENRNNKDDIQKTLVLGSVFLLLIAFLGYMLIYLFSEKFFVIYAGENWAISGEIASILGLWVLSAFANIIATSFLTVFSKFKQLLFYDSIFLISRSGVVLVCIYYDLMFMDFLLYYSLVGMAFNLYIVLYSMWLSKNEENIYC
ncbi:oligosaccharide flippase family protein [Vibrio vulnificus]